MVLKHYIGALKAVSGFIFLVFCFSCEDRSFTLLNCYECTVDEPDRAKLEIKLEKLSRYAVTNPTIYITIFEGNPEDGIVFKSIQTSSNKTTASVPLNKNYTLTATYYIDGGSYTAVNSVTPQVKYTEDICEEPCYYVTDKSVNLRLKYIN